MVFVQADELVGHLTSAVRAELAASGADLELLVKLNAGALEKYDKMEKSLGEWSMLGEVRPKQIHTLLLKIATSFLAAQVGLPLWVRLVGHRGCGIPLGLCVYLPGGALGGRGKDVWQASPCESYLHYMGKSACGLQCDYTYRVP